jgi:hypothetical protein
MQSRSSKNWMDATEKSAASYANPRTAAIRTSIVPGSEATLFQVKSIAQYHCFVEGQSWFRTEPGDELVDGMLISAH